MRKIFITLSRLKKDGDIEALVKKGFERNGLMQEGVNELIRVIYSLHPYRSDRYEIIIGRAYEDRPKSP